MKFKFKLEEAAGLSRLENYLNNYDIACISADKYLPDRQEFETQKEYEDKYRDLIGKQKRWDAKALRIQLWSKYSGVVKIKGFYQYNAESLPDKENSFLVANINNDENFKDDILQLAVKCKQNSIFFSPKNTHEGYWIYTGIDLSEDDEIDKNHSYGDVSGQGPIHLAKRMKNSSGETAYSLINGRPFAAYNVIEEEIENNYSRRITREDGEYMKRFENM